ncbi:hypothetical protein DSO57_1014499 [Entomophthora muscae]|uniref:Uncharacterized protein n=1 Tax=Entomophthora muscae TaxID=34485 RepID=A0ACC2SIU2_9FUNG|nr:hypothetical protein DSO57_1014499 [Entomophthora muscae]
MPWVWRVSSHPATFGPSPEGLGHDYHYDPGQLNSSNTGSWPPLVSPAPLHLSPYNLHLLCVAILCWELQPLQPSCQALPIFDDHLPCRPGLGQISVCQPPAVPASGNPNRLREVHPVIDAGQLSGPALFPGLLQVQVLLVSRLADYAVCAAGCFQRTSWHQIMAGHHQLLL